MAKQNNSNSFSGRSTNTTTVATNTATNNITRPTITYRGNLHTRDLAQTLYLTNPRGILVSGNNESLRRVYNGWYYVDDRGQYRTGKAPLQASSKQNTSNPIKLTSAPDTDLKNKNYNGNTGYYSIYFNNGDAGYYYAQTDQPLTFDDQDAILRSGYNGEAGAQEPQHVNYIVGNMIRYFARKRGTKIYQEINSQQYNDIGNRNSVWDRRAIPWEIASNVQEATIQTNKKLIWLVEAGGLIDINNTISSTPSSTSPSSFIPTRPPIFSYNGPSFYSDGTPASQGVNPPRINIKGTTLFFGRDLAFKRGKGTRAFTSNGNVSSLLDPWPNFFNWFRNHEGGGGDDQNNKSKDTFFYITPYLKFTEPNTPLNNNDFVSSIMWELIDNDYISFSKYYVNIMDVGTDDCNAFRNGQIQSTSFYDTNSPSFKPNKPLYNRVDLKNGLTYTFSQQNLYPVDSTINNNSTLMQYIWTTLAYDLWPLYYNTANATLSPKDGNILYRSFPTWGANPSSSTVSDSSFKLLNSTPRLYQNTHPGDFVAIDPNDNKKTVLAAIPNGGKGEAIFFRSQKYGIICKGYVVSKYTIYQHTGELRPSNETLRYDNVYYTLPKKGVSLFKADGTPRNYQYKGSIFEVYRDCEAAKEFKTVIFTGVRPQFRYFSLNKSRNNTKGRRIPPNIPLFDEDYFKNHLYSNFNNTEVVNYLRAINVSPIRRSNEVFRF